jgi:hypothetical protein
MLSIEITILMAILGMINGGWMIFDGFYALRNKKYFGPEEPGPWAMLVKKIGLEPLSMAKPLIVLGISWIVAIIFLFVFQIEIFWYLVILLAIGTLWYLPIGSIISFFLMILLIFFKNEIL